jgi:hypothetical protein
MLLMDAKVCVPVQPVNSSATMQVCVCRPESRRARTSSSAVIVVTIPERGKTARGRSILR